MLKVRAILPDGRALSKVSPLDYFRLSLQIISYILKDTMSLLPKLIGMLEVCLLALEICVALLVRYIGLPPGISLLLYLGECRYGG